MKFLNRSLNNKGSRIILLILLVFVISLLFPSKGFPQDIKLTSEEKEWLSSQKTIIVANELDWPPFDFVENDKPAGYSIDLIKLIAHKTGLDIDFVNGFTWTELMSQFRDGEIDILPAVYKDDERSQYMAFTSSYFSQPTVLITNSNNSIQSIEDLNNKKVAVIEGFSITTEIEKQYPEIIRVPVNGVLDGLKKVSTGELVAFIESIGVVSYYMENNYLPNIKIISDTKLDKMELPPLFIGVQKDNILLRSILQKGLDSILLEEMKDIRLKWITIDVKEPSEANSNFSLIWKVTLILIIAFIILYFVFKWFFNRSIKEETALQFGSKKFRIKSIITLGILVLVIAGLGWLSVVYIETKFSQNIKLQLDNDLNSAHGRIEFWLSQKKEHLKSLGHDEQLVELSSQLLQISDNFNKDKYNNIHRKLAVFFKEHKYKGSFIIDRESNNIGSEDPVFVGKPNIIANYRSALTKAVFKGEVVFIPPILSDSIIEILSENSKSSMMYFAIPITDTSHNVIAALIQEIDPAYGFSEILQLSHVGETGESYVFNRNGRMLSRSRFEKDLMNLGIFQEDQFGNLSMEVRNPGGNLTTGFETEISRQLQPLTLMAMSATNGKDGINIKGYNDYRGVEVMGAWQWIDEMELGLATEIDVEEAMTLFFFIRLSAIIVLGITLIFIIGSILFTLTLGEKANFALIKAKEELEDRVIARTQELNKANEQVKSIIENASDAIISIDIHRNIVFFNPAAERIFGFTTNEIAGKSFGIIIPEIAEKFKKSNGNSEPIDETCILFNKREIEALKSDGTKLFMENSVSTMEQDGDTFHTVFLRDITARKKAEKQLKTQVAAMESAANGIMVTDIDGTIQWVNPAFTQLSGYTFDEAVGEKPSILKSGKLDKVYYKKLWTALLSGESWHEEIINKRKNGELYIEEQSITPVFDDKNQLTNFVAIKQDISVRKKSEKRLISQSAALKSAANGIVITNTNGIVEWVNPAFTKLTGYSWKEVVGKTPRILKSGKHDKAFFENLWETILKGEVWHDEVINKKKNGELYYEEMTITPILNDKKETIQFVAIKQDITERRKLEDRVKESEQRFSFALEGSDDGLWDWDLKTGKVFMSSRFETMLGHEAGSLDKSVETLLALIQEDDLANFAQPAIEEHLSGKSDFYDTEYRMTTNSGDLMWIKAKGKVVSFDKDGQPLRFVGTHQDISDHKKLELALEKANKRMSGELNVAKDIQMSMLPLIFPAFPQRTEIDLFASLIPAREVGGDFYDFYFLDENNICFVVGDVSGKGVPAALMMAVTKTLLKSQAGNDNSTASILTHVNNEIAKDNTNYMFITVFMAILNTSTGELVYSNAGHNPSFIINNETHALTKLKDLHGPVVGAMEGMTYTETRLNINKDDIILAYTDGVTEAHNKDEELYSDAKFENLLETADYDSTETLTNLIVESVHAFEDGAEQFDDITVLALQYKEDPYTVDIKSTSIKIENKLVEITTAIDQFESFGMEHNIPMAIIQKFNIAFDEMLNNIISYGYDDEKEHSIEVDVELKGERLIITLTDDGIPFNPFHKDPPDTMLTVEERGIGGLGIHIVKTLMDEYTYKRNADKNIITLIKFNINT